MGRGRLGYQYRLAKLPPAFGTGLYGLIWGDAGNTWDSANAISTSNLLTAYALGLGAHTIIGPLYFAYGQAEGGIERLYLSLGRAF